MGLLLYQPKHLLRPIQPGYLKVPSSSSRQTVNGRCRLMNLSSHHHKKQLFVPWSTRLINLTPEMATVSGMTPTAAVVFQVLCARTILQMSPSTIIIVMEKRRRESQAMLNEIIRTPDHPLLIRSPMNHRMPDTVWPETNSRMRTSYLISLINSRWFRFEPVCVSCCRPTNSRINK